MSERPQGGKFSDQANVIGYKIEDFRNIPKEELGGAIEALKRDCDTLQAAFSKLISDNNCPHIQGVAPVLYEEGRVVPFEIFIARHLAEILTQVSASEGVVLRLTNFSEFLSLVRYKIEQYLSRGCMTRLPGKKFDRSSICTHYPDDTDDRNNLLFGRLVKVNRGIPGIQRNDFYMLSALGSNISVAVSIYPEVVCDILSFVKDEDVWSILYRLVSNIKYYGGLTYEIIMGVKSNEMGISLWGNPQGNGLIEAGLGYKQNIYNFHFV